MRYNRITMILFGFQIDLWTLFGLTAQSLFFLRFVLQWYASEKQKRIIIPVNFWYISLVAAVMAAIYGWARRDVVFLLAGLLQLILFSRNLVIARKPTPVSHTAD